MTTWIIEPRDPLIVRDGRPFGPTPGARAATLSFPFPSTTAGGLRTRAGLNEGGIFDGSLIATVKKIRVRGPLLVELGDDGEIRDWLCPAPADALLVDLTDHDEKRAIRKRLVPLKLPNTILSDLDLKMIGPLNPDLTKPHSEAPSFWYWKALNEWLGQPTALAPDGDPMLLEELGHKGPAREVRTHVSIEAETQASREGALFQTRGIEFSILERAENRAVKSRLRLALAIAADDLQGQALNGGLAPLGGERRLVVWRESQRPSFDLFSSYCPKAIRDEIKKNGHCRVVLLTPAHFANGSRPTNGWADRGGVRPNLLALAISRSQIVSGWDFEQGKPKPTRRLAPVGTTFFLDLQTTDATAIDAWIDEVWMKCVSDKPPDCFDGFGLAVLGAWDAWGREEAL